MMKTKKSTEVRSHWRQPQVRKEREMLLDEFKTHLNTAVAAPGGPARRELVSIVRRSNHHLGQSIADVVARNRTSKTLAECLDDKDAEAAASQIILGEKKQEASRKATDWVVPQKWFDHVITA